MKKIIIIGLLMALLLTGCSSNSKKLNASDIFTDRDLKQTVDTSSASKYTVTDNKDITITKEGIYVISGSAEEVSIIVDAAKDAKVQLVLSDLTITNKSNPCIYVKEADKVFVTMMGDNSLTVSGTFTSDGDVNTDAVIFSKDDLVLNGTGTLKISSTDNGITSKDDLKITGGTITINCVSDALEANDSIAIADGNITINTKKDGLHAEYDEDDSVGYIYIGGGTLNVTASDDAVHATTIIQIDGGNITLNAKEGLEATYIEINDGTINITASDDGINAGEKSSKYTVGVKINGGSITIDMGQGDTDAIDSNGYLYIYGGTLNITAQSPFDYNGEGELKNAKVTVNGSETTELTNQMMGGGPGGPGHRR